jgi:hypothetical protein
VLFADDAGVEQAAVGVERVDRGVDALLGDLAVEHRRGVEVGKGGRGRRVGEVVGGHVDGLHRGDRARLVEVMRSCRAPISVARVGW